MAREAEDVAWALGIEPVFGGRDEAELRAWHLPAKVIMEQDVSQHINMPYVIGIGENSIRRAIAEPFLVSLSFTSMIHPSATFGCGQRDIVEYCKGTIVAAGARFTSSIAVGDFCMTVARFGLAFKPDIDDLRESPALDITKKLAAEGRFKVVAVEPNIEHSSVAGVQVVSLEQGLQADVLVLLVDHKPFKRFRPECGFVVDTRGVW